MVNVDKIIAYENGDLDPEDVINLFADLVRSGEASLFQGSYGRTAARLIEAGYISMSGDVLNYPE